MNRVKFKKTIYIRFVKASILFQKLLILVPKKKAKNVINLTIFLFCYHFNQFFITKIQKNPKRLSFSKRETCPALRSSSFHGSRCFPRRGTIVKSPHVAPKKSGLSSSSTSLKSKKEGHEDVTAKKAPEKEIALDTSSLSSTQEDEEKTLKVESDVQVGDDIEQDEDEEENIEVHVAVVHDYESGEENNFDGPTLATSPVGEEIVVAKAEEERLMNEDDSEEKEQQNNGELYEEVKKKIDEDDTSEKVDINTSLKEVESVQETTEEQEEVKEEKEVNKEDKEKVEEEENEKVKLKKKNQEKETRAK